MRKFYGREFLYVSVPSRAKVSAIDLSQQELRAAYSLIPKLHCLFLAYSRKQIARNVGGRSLAPPTQARFVVDLLVQHFVVRYSEEACMQDRFSTA